MKRMLTVVGALIAGLAFFGQAEAQISGWGWWGFSSLYGQITTLKTPKKPSVLVIDTQGTQNYLVVQISCLTNGGQGVSNGNAFFGDIVGTGVVATNVSTVGGTVTTGFVLDLTPFEDPLNCQNPNWRPIGDSAMVLSLNARVTWYQCNGTDPNNPCATYDSSPKGTLDSEVVSCSWNTAAYPRLPDGTAPHVELGANPPAFNCNAPTPPK